MQKRNSMGRVLALDYGTKRTGIAVSDSLKMIANGLDTVATHTLINFIENYCKKELVDTIVIGKPTQTNGKNSDTMGHIKGVVKRLKTKFPDKKIVYEDERFTSVLAQQAIRESGARKKTRQNKSLIDKVSATIILQSYLSKQTNIY